MQECYYRASEATIAFKWCAPEVIAHRFFSTKSDVWSFGVMLWELFSYGTLPYPGMTNAETAEKVLAGFRMSCPVNCPEQVCQLMQQCWEETPNRPSFLVYDNIDLFGLLLVLFRLFMTLWLKLPCCNEQ